MLQTIVRAVGGPWTKAGAENTVFPSIGDPLAVFFAALFLAAVASSLWIRVRRAPRAWFLDTTCSKWAARSTSACSRDPRYITDSLPIIAIGLCAAFSGPSTQRQILRWLPRAQGSTS